MTSLLFAGNVHAQAGTAAEEESIRIVLDAAASALGWSGRTEGLPLSEGGTMFIVRDLTGLLAAVRYEDAAAAEKVLAESEGGEKRKFHQFDAFSSRDGTSLKWRAGASVFSVGSGAGEAEKLAEALLETAVVKGLIKKAPATKSASQDSGQLPARISETAKEAPASGDPIVLEKLWTEFGRPLPEGTVDEAVEMARAVYGVDYRKTVARAAGGDRGELANLFVMSLDGAAAEIHAEVLYRLRAGTGPKVFDEFLLKQAEITRERVNGLISLHRENLGLAISPPPPSTPSEAPAPSVSTGPSVTSPPAEPQAPPSPAEAPPAAMPPETSSLFGPEGDPGTPLAGAVPEESPSLGRGEGSSARDPMDPEKEVLAISSDDYLVRPLTIPADVDDVKVSLRVLVPASTTLEMLESGRIAPGVTIQVSYGNAQGNSEVREWIVKPMEGWQQLSLVLKNIGDLREELSLGASGFEGTILLDDLKVTSAFPVFLAEEMYEHFQTPAQVVYFYVLDPLFSSGRVSNVGSPELAEGKVSIEFELDRQKQVLWFVEKSREADSAEVVVGPPNSGGDLFRLRRIDGKWAIADIEESEGI